MVRDPIYVDFVLPEWREAELHAAAQTRARQEAEERAEAQARRQVEQALAQLRGQLAQRRPPP